jgi:phosphatidylglycerophosphate synthase
MFDHQLREVKESLVRPAVRVCVALGLTPLALTYASGALGLLSAWLALHGGVWSAVAAWAASRVLDGLDGSVARATGAASDLGGFVDLAVDHVCYAAVPIAVAHSRAAGGGAELRGCVMFLFLFFFVGFFFFFATQSKPVNYQRIDRQTMARPHRVRLGGNLERRLYISQKQEGDFYCFMRACAFMFFVFFLSPHPHSHNHAHLDPFLRCVLSVAAIAAIPAASVCATRWTFCSRRTF